MHTTTCAGCGVSITVSDDWQRGPITHCEPCDQAYWEARYPQAQTQAQEGQEACQG